MDGFIPPRWLGWPRMDLSWDLSPAGFWAPARRAPAGRPPGAQGRRPPAKTPGAWRPEVDFLFKGQRV
jgi:hypothetical protein